MNNYNNMITAYGDKDISKTALLAWLYQACQIEDSLVKLKQQSNKQRLTVEQFTQQATHPFVEKVPTPSFEKSHFEFLEFVQMVIGLDVILTVVMEILMWMGEKEWDLFLGLIFCLPFSIIGCISLCWMEKRGVARKNRETQEEYDMQLKKWRKEVETIKNQAQQQLPLAKQMLQEEYQNIKNIENFRKKFYSNQMLHPIYQKREAVFVMYNMLITGRCDTLKEAINAYEDFLWKKEDAQWKASISQQLDHIIAASERMIWNMDDLRQQTHRIQELQRVSGQSIQSTSEEIARNTAIIRNNTDISLLLQGVGLIKRNS